MFFTLLDKVVLFWINFFRWLDLNRGSLVSDPQLLPTDTSKMDQPRPLFVLFKHKFYRKTVVFSRIRTWIVGVKGKHTDHRSNFLKQSRILHPFTTSLLYWFLFSDSRKFSVVFRVQAYQCDQMARLFFIILPFITKNCLKTYNYPKLTSKRFQMTNKPSKACQSLFTFNQSGEIWSHWSLCTFSPKWLRRRWEKVCSDGCKGILSQKIDEKTVDYSHFLSRIRSGENLK